MRPLSTYWLIASVFLLECLISGKLTAQDLSRYSDADKELILTKAEKVALDKFKGAVNNMNLSKELQVVKQDLFLLRWLRSKNLNVNVAVQDMLQFSDFAKRIRLDTILFDDFGDIAAEHPFSVNEAIDRQGRPVAYTSALVGWNLRRTVLQGKRERLMRYMYKLVFEIFLRTIEISKTHPNVTQFSVIFNVDGFNPFMHSCPICITSYITLFDIYERFLPGYAHKLIAINAPQAFLVVVATLKPFMSKYTKNAIQIYDDNKSVWKRILDDFIDPKYLPHEFGGTKPDW